MKTDIPLKLLTALRGADLLPLLGLPAASLVRVETRELPAGATRLNTLLRVRSPQGQDYLHLVEWQGYYDSAVLWRPAGYVAWFGQQEPGTTVVGTVVYLAPEYDVGDTLMQVIDGQVVQAWPVGRIQLWTQDAQAALAANSLGLAVLSPLMRNADASLVEAAARMVVAQAPPTQQGDLLSILGTFAEPLLQPQRFMNLVGRDKLMSSGLFDLLIQEREAELREELREMYETKLREQEEQLRRQQEEHLRRQQEEHLRRQQEEQFRQEVQQTLEDTLLIRFPAAPLALVRDIRRIQRPSELHRLIVAVQQVPDLAAAEELLHAAARQAGNSG